jgi:hypothetical protein
MHNNDMITSYWLEYSEAFTKFKSRKNSRAAGSFSPTSYTPDDGRLGRNM